MNVGINLVKYPQFFVIRIPKMCKFTIYKNIEILRGYAMHDLKRNFPVYSLYYPMYFIKIFAYLETKDLSILK